MSRTASQKRTTKETDIDLTLTLEGEGLCNVKTGLGFFDHMLNSFVFHGGFDLSGSVTGDLEVDAHHTMEDFGLVLGAVLREALGDKAGIARFGTASIPMDEALATAVVDISGRPFLVYDIGTPQSMVGGIDCQLFEEFFRAFAFSAGVTLHIKALYGANSHHMIEASFKAVARALSQAAAITGSGLPSTKGAL